jgi:transcriptional regulator with XRE-family HTH domain
MVQLTPDERVDRQMLSAALKAIRRRRGMSPTQVADAMGLPLRTYQYFEAGRGGLRLELIRAFAAATRGDPWAIVLAVAMRNPAFAARAVDYKIASLILILLKTLDAGLGDLLGLLDVATLQHRLRPAFKLLAQDGARLAKVQGQLTRGVSPFDDGDRWAEDAEIAGDGDGDGAE